MHVAFLTTEYPPKPCGGIGTSIRNLAHAAAAQGHRVTVVTWGPGADVHDRCVQVRFVRESSAPGMGWLLNRWQARRTLLSLIDQEGVDIVEAPDWCGLSAGIEVSRPLVIRCNGSATYFAHLLGTRARRSVVAAESLALQRADDVVAVSRFTAHVTRQLFKRPEPIGTIHNGIDLGLFPPAPPEQAETGRLLYVGAITRKKGVLDLCKAFSLVVERRPRAQLCLIGRDMADPGTNSPSTWALCREALSRAARRRTEYLGSQPYESVRAHLARAVACVLPSYAEALPLSWLEAMASARPVVAYDIGWAREVIEPGTSGTLVPAGGIDECARAMLALIDHPELGRRLGAAARQTVEARFDAALVARQTAGWYEQVIARHVRVRRPGWRAASRTAH